MLSRIAARSLQDAKPCLALIRTTHTTPVNKAEERDEVNFPRPVRQIEPSKVRMGFIPEEWFQLFYKKTGVTGPYVFGVGLSTFLMSKEIYVMEHEFYTGLSILIMVVYAIKKFGPSIAASLDKGVDEIEENWMKYRNDSVHNLKQAIEDEKKAQWQAEGQSVLFDAKKENIALQLEAAYRERLNTAYNEVKQRLDYQLETSNVKNRVEHKHMVNWIIDGVRSSITPAQESAALKQCIADLKGLSKA